MSEIQLVCGIISTICTVSWIFNQWFFYTIFKEHFAAQHSYIDVQTKIIERRLQLLEEQGKIVNALVAQ